MKFRKVWFTPLALLCLGGVGVGTKLALDARAASRTAYDPASSREKATGRSSSKARTREGNSDAQALARIRSLLQAEKFLETKEAFLSLESLIGNLSLEAVLELLDDPEALANADGDKFPLRHLIRSLLWQRFGELAPELALERAFPEGGLVPGSHVHIDRVLHGVAKVDRELAFASWKAHFGNEPEDVFMTFLMSFFEDWSKSSPEASFAALEGLGKNLRQDAYKGYLRSLTEETDWQTERAKFEKLFPDPKDRTFRPQFAVCSLASQWVLSDPEAAFAWVESLPLEERPANFASFHVPGSERAEAFGQMVATWVREEPAEAAEWLKHWKAPGNSDRFYAQMIQYRGSEDVSISSTALELISDPAVRDEVVREVLTQEFQKREVLRMWETSPRLSPEVRAEVSKAIRTRDDTGSGWTF